MARARRSPATARPTAWSSSAASAGTSRRRSRTSSRACSRTLEKETWSLIGRRSSATRAIHKRTKGVGRRREGRDGHAGASSARWPGPAGVDIDARTRPSLRRLRRHELRRPGRRHLRRLGHASLVRVLEIFESIKIIRQALDKMPADGPHPHRDPRGTCRRSATPCPSVEAPRGEVGPLRHHRRGEPARAVARPGPDLSEPAGRAGDAPEQPVRRLADHPRQHRPLLLLHGPGRGRRRRVGREARLSAGPSSSGMSRAASEGREETSHEHRLPSSSMSCSSSLLAPLFEGVMRKDHRPGPVPPGSADRPALLRPLQAPRQGETSTRPGTGPSSSRPLAGLRLDPRRRRRSSPSGPARTPWAAASTPSPSSTC
ncbi:MAG: hypothetical protein MZV63_65485 [Marinilabiliales bacterium]|nr:hypothetical protein [Marinilabiliales bacterium]